MLSKHIVIRLLCFFGVVAPFTTQAQTLQGRVLDAFSKDSLSGVHVIHITQGTGTITDASGHFRIAAQAQDSLRFSLIGYRPQTVVAQPGFQLVELIPDTVMLQGISVSARRINMYSDTTAQPLRLPGVPYVDHPKRVKPMTWKWGQGSFSGDALQQPMLGVSGVLLGPISYFMPYERNQRRYERIQQEAYAQQGYRQAIYDEENRKFLMENFQLTSQQYDSLLIIFNQQHLALVEGADREEALGILFRFFSKALK